MKAVKLRLQILERSEARLKAQARERAERIKDMKVEVEQAQREALKAGDPGEGMKETIEGLEQGLERELEKYQGWWLTEHYSLKVMLGLVPNKKDVKAIAMAAQARFETCSGKH